MTVSLQNIEECIYLIRGQRVMLDADLAKLYCIATKRLNEQVRRNPKRFPEDFMFQLEAVEVENLRSQFATSRRGHGGRRYRPFAFTEQGVAMLSSVLNTERAIQVNVEIMRAFVHIRRMISVRAELAKEIQRLEKRYDTKFKIVFDAIRQLMEPSKKTKRHIGF